jgi:hypothetical protein
MSGARPYGLTNHDVRRMREMRAAGQQLGAIAEAFGVYRSTVVKYAGDVEPDRSVLASVQTARSRLQTRALRYTAFVERAAAYVPLLVSPSPF